jgi:hypothetical protein
MTLPMTEEAMRALIAQARNLVRAATIVTDWLRANDRMHIARGSLRTCVRDVMG